MSPGFEILRREGRARLGRLTTPHGVIDTPAFMPVGTLGAVKGVGPLELADLGASIMLANLYHLSVRPGIETIVELGGLHAFTGWRGPLITDSGGFQVMSLAPLRRIDDEGVSFRNHVDGGLRRFTPEAVVELQARLGVDLAMVLDECPPYPAPRPEVEAATARTARWAERSLTARRGGEGALFGIVQGGVHRELREAAAAEIGALGFDGHAIGGVSVGEPEAERRAVVEWTAPCLPEGRPRYLMGVGTLADLLHGVEQGIDLFDCVLPSRNARHGVLFTLNGPLRIKNAVFRRDPRPIDEACGCPACRSVSRAFLHHLVRSRELTGAVLSTLHNVRVYLDFMARLRQALEAGELAKQAPRLRRQVSGEEPVAAAAPAANNPH